MVEGATTLQHRFIILLLLRHSASIQYIVLSSGVGRQIIPLTPWTTFAVTNVERISHRPSSSSERIDVRVLKWLGVKLIHRPAFFEMHGEGQGSALLKRQIRVSIFFYSKWMDINSQLSLSVERAGGGGTMKEKLLIVERRKCHVVPWKIILCLSHAIQNSRDLALTTVTWFQADEMTKWLRCDRKHDKNWVVLLNFAEPWVSIFREANGLWPLGPTGYWLFLVNINYWFIIIQEEERRFDALREKQRILLSCMLFKGQGRTQLCGVNNCVFIGPITKDVNWRENP